MVLSDVLVRAMKKQTNKQKYFYYTLPTQDLFFLTMLSVLDCSLQAKVS